MHKLSDQIERKFTDVIPLNEWDILTDTGWAPLVDIKQTIKYEVYDLELANGYKLSGADTHIMFDANLDEVFIKDLIIGSVVITDAGPVNVSMIRQTGESQHMYDVGVDSENHRFYSNGILSHNTTSAGGYLLWYAMFVPDSTILIAAHQYSGAQEIMQRIRYAYEMCPMWLKAGTEAYNQGNIDFDNKSRIVARATTEKTGRGMSLSLLYLDEFAFVRPTIAKEFWAAISPTLSTGGKCIITSTPNSDEDQFSLLWKGANKKIDEFGMPTELGVNGFSPFISHWAEHPDRDETWATAERGRIGDERFRREHGLEFLIFDETLISPTTLIEMAGIDPVEKQGQVRWFKRPARGNTYMVGLDPSMGTGGDPAAIQILELPSLMQVGEWQHNKTPIQRQVIILKEVTEYIYNLVGADTDIYYSVENNSLGEAALVTIQQIGEENIHGVFLSEPSKPGQPRRGRKGFNTTQRTKLAVCAKAKSLIEHKKLRIASKNLISELKNFVASGGSYAAKIGETDDLVMSLMLVIRMTQALQAYDANLDELMKDSEQDYLQPMPFIMSSY
jgi:hypothetical protein